MSLDDAISSDTVSHKFSALLLAVQLAFYVLQFAVSISVYVLVWSCCLGFYREEFVCVVSALHASCPTHPTLFDLVILITFGEQKLLVKHITVHFSNITVFCPNVVPIAVFTQWLSFSPAVEL
jgi:hypothetical protein